MHRSRTFGLRVAFGLAALALVAAACSSSKSHNGQGATGSPAPSGPSGTPFKIGYIEDAVSLGSGTSEPYTIPAFRAWVDWTNAHGGINGHPVQLIADREPNNPGIALTDVKSMVGKGIVALVEDDTNDGNAWINYVQQQGVPVFSATSPSLNVATSPIAFSTNTSILVTPAYTVASAAKVGAPKMAAFYCAEIPTCAESIPALKSAGQSIGVTVEFSSAILGSAPNYTPQCLSAKSSGAQSMWVADASTIVLRVAASCAQQGYTPHQVVSGETLQQNFTTSPGMDGLIAADGYIPFFETSFPGVATMTQAFNQYDPSLLKLPEYGDLSTQQWATGLLIGQAATAGNVGSSNPLTAAALLNGIYTLHSTNLGGMTPTLTFTRGKAATNKCWFWVAIQNGKYVMPYGMTPACSS